MTQELDLAQLRADAEAFIAADDKLMEIGEGVGGLAIREPELMEDWRVWDRASEYKHADTVLTLIDRAEQAEQAVARVRAMAEGSDDKHLTMAVLEALDGDDRG